MATVEGTASPVTQEIVNQATVHQVVVVQQPIQQQQVVVVQNPSAVNPAINQPNVDLNAMTKEQKNSHIRQQVALSGGNCWRMTLIILWGITLAGGVVQLILGSWIMARRSGSYYEPKISIIFAVVLPGVITIIGGSISIYGVHKYHHKLTIFSAATTGILLLIGATVLIAPNGAIWFLLAYVAPFVMYSCIFSFSIVFAKHISFVNKNGYPDSNGCCKCGNCCCGPTQAQSVVYQQSGIPLQVAAGESTTKYGTQAPQQQVVVVQQNGNNENAIRRAMIANGGYCWKVTLIVLWSILLAGAAAQFLSGALIARNSYTVLPALQMALTVPGGIGLVSGSISIYGLNRFNYKISVFSCIASGILMFIGLMIFPFEWGFLIFAVCYVPPFVFYAVIFSFSIVYTKKLSFVLTHGHGGNVEEDCCKGCYQGCNCEQSCGQCC